MHFSNREKNGAVERENHPSTLFGGILVVVRRSIVSGKQEAILKVKVGGIKTRAELGISREDTTSYLDKNLTRVWKGKRKKAASNWEIGGCRSKMRREGKTCRKGQ